MYVYITFICSRLSGHGHVSECTVSTPAPILREQPQAVGRPDVIAMSSAMTALSGAHLWQKALLLFQRLPARSRDVVSYGAAMTAAAIGKHWELGLFWLMEMKKLN